MNNKVILITGASSGIGEACARLLHRNGAEIILVARNQDKLNDIKLELGEKVHIFPYDLNDIENIKTIFDFCKDQSLKLDGMIHSAGVGGECPIKVNNISRMEEAMRINCFSFVELGRLFYSKRYSNDGAAIVAISSIASIVCDMGMGYYSASKAALNAFVKTMSKEFEKRKIRVNAVLPGGVKTKMSLEKTKIMSSIQNLKNTKDEQFLGYITPENIAEQVEFLLSEKSMYTTGEFMVIGGGRSF